MPGRSSALLGLLLALCAGILCAPASADPTPTGPVALDTSGLIAQPSGLQMSIARDGTGGLVYLRRDPGTGSLHVYLSRLIGGSFSAPVPLDASLGGSSSQPVLAAGNGGVVLAAFVNGGVLYTVTVPSASSPVPAPQGLAGSGTNPAISMSDFGKAYLVFTVPDGSGSDVRSAFYAAGTWHPVSAPLNNLAGDDAGTGAGRPAVATGGDGIGVAAWGEGGQIFSRRIVGTSPSIVLEQANGPLPGCTEAGVSNPVVGTEGDSDYADVAWLAQMSCGGAAATPRALVRRLRGSIYQTVAPVDGLPAGSAGNAAGATAPQIAIGEYGRGWVTAARSDTNDLFGTLVGNAAVPGATSQINGEPDTGPPFAVPALAGLTSTFMAWQQTPGPGSGAEVVTRYAQNGSKLSPEVVLSAPAGGPTDAADGLAAAGDVQGNAAVAWLQGTPGSPALFVDQLFQPPGSVAAASNFAYARSRTPALSWLPANELWGPVTYTVSVDGSTVGQTQSTHFTLPQPLADGTHSWQISAANRSGRTSGMRPASLWVDAVRPTAALSVSGVRQVGSYVHVSLIATDTPPGEPPTAASGLITRKLDFGDGSSYSVSGGKFHAYRRPGTYRITATVRDRAGNTTLATTLVRIKSKPRSHKAARVRPRAKTRRSAG